MNRIIDVIPLDNYELLITFENGEKRKKDMKPYLQKGVFKKLNDKDFFKKVKIAFGTISWGENIDLCADNIYKNSEIVEM